MTGGVVAMVSQRTSEAVFGIPKRAFLESLHRYRAAGGVVSSLGKLRLVDVDGYRAWLRSDGSAEQESDPVKRAVAAARARRDALG